MTFGQWLTSNSWMVGAAITIIGWGVVFRLQVVAQRKMFLLEAQKEAWHDLHRATLKYQEQLLSVNNKLNWAWAFLHDKSADEMANSNAIRTCREWSEMADYSAASDWLFQMEHYEAVFPTTASVRLQLANINQLITDSISSSRRATFGPSHTEDPCVKDLAHALEPAWRMQPLVVCQEGLLQDLLIHLQNSLFKALTGHEVHPRCPAGTEYVRLRLNDRDRQLHIVDGSGKVHDVQLSQTMTEPVPVDWI